MRRQTLDEIVARASGQKIGIGDIIERLAKPIAIALKLPCLDKNNQLKPESPCAKRRDKLNRLTR